MSRPTTTSRKQKSFPALDAPIPNLPIQEIDSDLESSDNDSDAPEAVTLIGGRAAADARDVAVKEHELKVQARRKEKNKAREKFIESTKPKESEADALEEEDDGSEREEDESGPSDPALEARMARAMQDAQDEESSEEEGDESAPAPKLSSRLPDSIFAAAAAANQSSDRKRARKESRKEDSKTKRRRMREVVEPVVNGRTIRVSTPLDAPPPISTSKKKVNKGTKGGAAFRRKWKKLDALRSQVRSRSGPARNFVTAS